MASEAFVSRQAIDHRFNRSSTVSPLRARHTMPIHIAHYRQDPRPLTKAFYYGSPSISSPTI